jgi:hypothetical protein
MAITEQGSINVSDLSTETNQDILISLLDNYAVRVAVDSGVPTTTYLGQATTGSAEGSAVWQIKKIDEASGTSITWADSNTNFDNIWTNRQALTYG